MAAKKTAVRPTAKKKPKPTASTKQGKITPKMESFAEHYAPHGYPCGFESI